MMQATNVTAHKKGGENCQQSLISELVWGKAPKTKIKAKFEEWGKPPKPNSDVANFSVYESV